MKNHHNCPKVSIGSSDLAELIVRGPGKVGTLAFGEDGSYRAYIVDRDCDIPGYYKQVFECRNWIVVYDDEGKSFEIENHGSTYRVFRAGEFGCIIQRI